jgi:hypothetical protein
MVSIAERFVVENTRSSVKAVRTTIATGLAVPTTVVSYQQTWKLCVADAYALIHRHTELQLRRYRDYFICTPQRELHVHLSRQRVALCRLPMYWRQLPNDTI